MYKVRDLNGTRKLTDEHVIDIVMSAIKQNKKFCFEIVISHSTCWVDVDPNGVRVSICKFKHALYDGNIDVETVFEPIGELAKQLADDRTEKQLIKILNYVYENATSFNISIDDQKFSYIFK